MSDATLLANLKEHPEAVQAVFRVSDRGVWAPQTAFRKEVAGWLALPADACRRGGAQPGELVRSTLSSNLNLLIASFAVVYVRDETDDIAQRAFRFFALAVSAEVTKHSLRPARPVWERWCKACHLVIPLPPPDEEAPREVSLDDLKDFLRYATEEEFEEIAPLLCAGDEVLRGFLDTRRAQMLNDREEPPGLGVRLRVHVLSFLLHLFVAVINPAFWGFLTAVCGFAAYNYHGWRPTQSFWYKVLAAIAAVIIGRWGLNENDAWFKLLRGRQRPESPDTQGIASCPPCRTGPYLYGSK